MELRLESITKSFKDKKAVNQVSMTLQKGIHGLLGANGSGKTTLLRMICGLLAMDEGKLYFNDMNALEKYHEYTSKLGYMPQHFGYYPNYSIVEFLSYMAIVKGLSKEEGNVKINQLLKTLHLEDKRKTKMSQLSGGMIKRVGIAQALLNDPDILILDEPTAGLDPKERIVFRNLIASLSQQCVVILSTHIVSDIETIADDIIVMKEGQVLLQDTCDNLLAKMSNKVWEVSVDKKVSETMLLSNTVVSSHNKDELCEMRIVSDAKPHPLAKSVKADLDDLYLYYFQGEQVWGD